ncbi:hypothetical protein ACPRNU_09115 [Chromobacterium vaccinii]|uniref:hypothetical protein n=1 Tax=Chromobacterium TaxID=535 RepID=UPI0013053087|nr:hypothetical protein [Chromobacterium sp. ATCC 53434]
MPKQDDPRHPARLAGDAPPAPPRELSRLLDTALRAIVGQYFRDKRIRAIYRLATTCENLLLRAGRHPYQVGFYRPDFVYDRDGQARVCGLGARYPLSGWMVGQLIKAFHGPAPEARPDHGALLKMLSGMYPPDSAVAMVHTGERGGEVLLLTDELRRCGVRLLQAHPMELQCDGDRVWVRDQPVDRCILEMDRSELPLIPAAALTRLIETGAYCNDVRTLILVHDKRALAVLNHAGIMGDCMEAADYAALQPFLIPSFALASQQEAEALLARPGRLIAKPNSGGRGAPPRLSDGCGADEWRRLVRREWPRYMFQEYIEQREFADPETGCPVHLVGTLLCHNAASHGGGVFGDADERLRRGKLYSAMVAA